MTDHRHKDPIRAAIFGISRLRAGTDGHGVTTLVAFMGCPLECRYCLNAFCHESVYRADGRTLRRGVMMLTPEELLCRVMKDNIYFQATGGGICFGGGEPGLHTDFIEEFRRICPPKWRITIETCLAYGRDTIGRLSKVVDQWIVDIKEMDARIYERYTGRHCENIRNLTCLKENADNCKVTIKVPLIPGYNTDEDVRKSMDEIQRLGFTDIVRYNYIIKT